MASLTEERLLVMTCILHVVYNPRLKTLSEAPLRKPILILSLVLASIILAACASNTDAPAQAVQNYLNALVNKEADKIPTLVCGDWLVCGTR